MGQWESTYTDTHSPTHHSRFTLITLHAHHNFRLHFLRYTVGVWHNSNDSGAYSEQLPPPLSLLLFSLSMPLLPRIYPPEHFKTKYALDEVKYTDEVIIAMVMLWALCKLCFHSGCSHLAGQGTYHASHSGKITDVFLYHSTYMYHIARNFQRVKFSRKGDHKVFADLIYFWGLSVAKWCAICLC